MLPWSSGTRFRDEFVALDFFPFSIVVGGSGEGHWVDLAR